MQSGCQSNDVKFNALTTIDRAEKSDVTKIQREAIGMWGSRLSVRYSSERTYANATLMGLKLSLNRIASDDSTGMIEVLSQQLRNLYRAETHKYCEQVSRVRQKMRRARQTPYRAKVEL